MKTCKKCKQKFPKTINIDGVKKSLACRRYCLTCSPWGRHNNSQLEKIRHDGKKTCNSCHQDFPEKEFKRKNGKRTEAKCRDCLRQADREHARMQKKFCTEYLGGACSACGYKRCVAALDIHHIDPSQKEFTLTKTKFKKETLLNELNKCQLLCKNCHAEHHYFST